MIPVEFYFDPSCPFCWIASRWLLQVSRDREIDITWRQFSLALKNNELEPREGETKHAHNHRGAHRVQRVIYEALRGHDTSMIDLYSEFGIRFHIMERSFDDAMILEVLKAKSLPTDLLAAVDDSSLDASLQAEIDSATSVAGQDIGVPTIVFTAEGGERLGYYGPVLNELPPTQEECLKLWDGLAALASVSYFYELKRSRSGDPNVFSAAKC